MNHDRALVGAGMWASGLGVLGKVRPISVLAIDPFSLFKRRASHRVSNASVSSTPLRPISPGQ